MKTVTKLSTAVALTAAMSVPAFADTGVTQLPAEAVNATDLSYAFGSTQDLQVMDMTGTEMSETEGAVAPWVVGAGVGGVWQGANYAYGAYKGNYNWNTSRFLGNVASGAVIGGSFGAAGKIASGDAKFIPSLTNTGANIWRGNAAVTNWGVNHAWRR